MGAVCIRTSVREKLEICLSAEEMTAFKNMASKIRNMVKKCQTHVKRLRIIMSNTYMTL